MNHVLERKLAALESETKALFESTGQLTEEELHDQTYGWSIIQVLAHLNEAERGSVLYMKKKMQAGDKMPDFGVGNRLRMFLTKRLLNSSLRWKAPKYVDNPKSEHTMAQMKSMWESTRLQTRDYVANYPEAFIGKAVYKHPMAGRLDLANAIDSMTYHQRHHLHQIKRIKKAIGHG